MQDNISHELLGQVRARNDDQQQHTELIKQLLEFGDDRARSGVGAFEHPDSRCHGDAGHEHPMQERASKTETHCGLNDWKSDEHPTNARPTSGCGQDHNEHGVRAQFYQGVALRQSESVATRRRGRDPVHPSQPDQRDGQELHARQTEGLDLESSAIEEELASDHERDQEANPSNGLVGHE